MSNVAKGTVDLVLCVAFKHQTPRLEINILVYCTILFELLQYGQLFGFTFQFPIILYLTKITNEGLIPTTRISSILFMQSDLKWSVNFGKTQHCIQL